MTKDQMIIGVKYNWINQSERLVYLGHNWSGNGYWHQFAKVDTPSVIWSEILDSELKYIEVTEDSDQP